MDLAVGWFQVSASKLRLCVSLFLFYLKEEQHGQALKIWSNIWDTTETEFQQQQMLQQQQQANNGNNSDTKSNDSNTSNNNFSVEGSLKSFNPTRRKGSSNDNKASTYNMNKYQARLVGKFGGCPWRPIQYHYARGIVG